MEWAASDACPFNNFNAEAGRCAGYYDTETIYGYLRDAIESGELESEATLDSAAVGDALHDLLSQQQQGQPLGVLSRYRLGLSRLWRIVPPDEETKAAHGANGAALSAVLRRVLAADELTVDDATVDRLLTEMGALESIVPLVGAIAAAAAPLPAADVDIQLLLTLTSDLIGQAEATAHESVTTGGGGVGSAGARRRAAPTCANAARHSPKKQRRASAARADGTPQSTVVVHSVRELAELLLREGLSRVLLAEKDEMLTLRRERDALLALSCQVISSLQGGRDLLKSKVHGARPPPLTDPLQPSSRAPRG